VVDLASVVRPGDGIICGQACAEPQTLLEALVAQRAALGGTRLFLGASYSGIVQAGHADHLRLSSYGAIGRNRDLAKAGALQILPTPYSRLGPMIRAGTIPNDVVLLQVSPPNARGEYSMGLAADYLVPALESARAVIAEINDQVPWTHSEKLLRDSDFALSIRTSRAPAAPPPSRAGALELAIARHAAEWIADGATLEFGIGTLPDAVCAFLKDRSGLAVHSGTIGDGVLGLAAGRIDCAMLIGTPKLFEFARENPKVRLRSSEYTHGPSTLAGIERFVAINSAVEVDLAGRINSESANGSYVGAVGGAPDFMRAASLSLVLIPAARVVEALSGPATVVDCDHVVVTEKGAADLRSCSLPERKLRLRAVA
jgi:acetyl-CoA hydrolase